MRPVLFRQLLAFTTLGFAPCGAAVSPAVVFTDHMVLQRDLPVPVWGQADPGEEVTVSFADQIQTCTAGADGRWRVTLAPLPASASPRVMTLRGQNTIVLHDVLVGEVWLCSGQSNMEKNLGPRRGQQPTDHHAEEIAAAHHPLLRLFQMPRHGKPAAGDTLSKRWLPCTPDVVDAVQFSAVGYFFGRELKHTLNVPVGILHSSLGGTRIELWTPPAGFASMASLTDFARAAEARRNFDGAAVSSLYHSMIAPLIPYALRGFLWYQGEANLLRNDFALYTDKTLALINGWRQLWNLPTAPFYSVQLAPHTYSLRRKPDPLSPSALPLFWEAQNAATLHPHSGIVITNDLAPDPSDVHPTNKKDVGLRLARLALTQTYGLEGIATQGPRYRSFAVDGNQAVLSFAVTRPLATRDKRPPSGFSVAAANRKFFPATATLDGDTVRVSAPEVSAPVAVRYGWHETQPGNLTDASGLPSPAFRTDNWDILWSRPATSADVNPK